MAVDSLDYPDWMVDDDWYDFLSQFDDITTNAEVNEIWSSTDG